MSALTDLMLRPPLPDPWARWLLFLTFFFHFLFVLILVGTAVIGNYHFLHSFWSQANFEHRWDKKMLKKFIIPKALAVVLGVGALLVMQTYFAVPFFAAVALFAPYWLLVVPVMIVGFFMIDGISHKMEVHPVASAVIGPLGMLLVLAVPAVFVTVLVATENTDQWAELARRSYQLNGALIIHWLLRYLHVVGAGLVFGAVFQYFITSEGHDYRERALVNWSLVGLLAQFVSGGALALTLQEWLSQWVLIPLLVGIGAAAVMVWLLFAYRPVLLRVPALVLLPVLLAGMLLTRQYIQQQKLLPFLSALRANSQAQAQAAEGNQVNLLAAYQTRLANPADTGAAIFERSCAFCHGLSGLGDGEASGPLVVPPEQIALVHASRSYLQGVLSSGVMGTAMPYFTYYDGHRLASLLAELNRRFHMEEGPGPIPVRASGEAQQRAESYFNGTCALCHGMHGAGTVYGLARQPPPPDFEHFGLAPQRAFEVIRDGYPGTAMRAFGELPEDVRWALVGKVEGFRAAH